jgi:O-antigen ligase
VLSQGYLAYELNLSYYFDAYNRVRDEGFGGMDNNCVSIAMVACTGPAFVLGLHTRQWWAKVLGLVSAGLMAHAVLLSFSRGGMIALIIVGVVTFLLIAKEPKHYAVFLVAVLLCLRLAGTEVRERFGTSFASEDELDASAKSRLDLWADCLDVMRTHPFQGLGPDHWPLVAEQYGWPPGKHAHTLWLQIGAELGPPGLLFLLLFYGLCLVRLSRLILSRQPLPDPWLRMAAQMVVASLIGFAVAAQFVSLPGLEVPYYIALLGAGVLKLSSSSIVPTLVPSSIP